MANNDEFEFNNLENTIKRLFPEYSEIAKIPIGPISNFAQQRLSESLNKGVPLRNGKTLLKNYFEIKEINDGFAKSIR